MLRKLVTCMIVSLSVATVYVAARGTPRIDVPHVSPLVVQAYNPAVVTVTMRIPDAKFGVYSVHLLRVDRRGDVLPKIEMTDEDGTNTDAPQNYRFFLVMRDDGTKGDAVANDRVFTRRVTVNEPSGPVHFEVKVNFKGVERPVRSAPFAVEVR